MKSGKGRFCRVGSPRGDGFEPKRVLSITKKLIRSLKYGNVIMFRVLIDGQFFEGGKVYTPADREYLATRPAGNP